MTAVNATSPAVEQYLRRATAGLPAAKRREVWDELEEHLYCRAEQLEWRGLPPEQALAQALAELGPPLKVSAAMNGVHNMPKILSLGGIAGLLTALGVYAAAQQPVLSQPLSLQTKAPLTICAPPTATPHDLPLVVKTPEIVCYQDDGQEMDDLTVSLSELQNALAPLGYELTLNDATGEVFVKAKQFGRSTGFTYIRYKQGGEAYLAVSDILLAAQTLPIPVTLETKPALTVKVGDKAAFVPATPGSEVTDRFLDVVAQTAASSVYDFSTQTRWGFTFNPIAGGQAQTIQTPFAAGEVVAAYVWESNELKPSPRGDYMSYHLGISRGVVDSEGKVRLNLPADAQFVTTMPKQVGPEVMLIRLTSTPLSDLKSGLFLPKTQ